MPDKYARNKKLADSIVLCVTYPEHVSGVIDLKGRLRDTPTEQQQNQSDLRQYSTDTSKSSAILKRMQNPHVSFSITTQTPHRVPL